MAARKQTDRTVASAVERDLKEIAKRDKGLAESALAMSALRLAREMDSSANSATSKSMCAKGLQEALKELRELAPEGQAKDGVDDLSERRAKRLAAGQSDAEDLQRTPARRVNRPGSDRPGKDGGTRSGRVAADASNGRSRGSRAG